MIDNKSSDDKIAWCAYVKQLGHETSTSWATKSNIVTSFEYRSFSKRSFNYLKREDVVFPRGMDVTGKFGQ